MYVLESNMQGQIKGPIWNSRARMAIYIGNSDNHAQSVGLALSIQTGLVSPTFHAKYDDQFTTIRDPNGNYIPRSQWQIKCGFSKGIIREACVKPKSADKEVQQKTAVSEGDDVS
jgi:hypothetical protein